MAPRNNSSSPKISSINYDFTVLECNYIIVQTMHDYIKTDSTKLFNPNIFKYSTDNNCFGGIFWCYKSNCFPYKTAKNFILIIET